MHYSTVLAELVDKFRASIHVKNSMVHLTHILLNLLAGSISEYGSNNAEVFILISGQLLAPPCLMRGIR